jgi:hypothetical protein
MNELKILFILKRKEDYCEEHYNHLGLSTGLFNSATFVNDMLQEEKLDTKLVIVVDNNDIDKEVTLYKPTHVIIEALWVVPSKFEVLQKLHPNVKWIIRLHSELPFIANEGMAMDWIGDYFKYKNVIIGVNSTRMLEEITLYAHISTKISKRELEHKIVYLPNYYPPVFTHKHFNDKKEIDISCFGAIRPLKNHLVQAFAAIKLGNFINKKLRFHINMGRYEGKGEPIYRNLKDLFKHLPADKFELVAHAWTPREEFLELCGTMDISMQCSLSETFNIVACDSLVMGVPIVGSDEIPWLCDKYKASPTSSDKIADQLFRAYKFPRNNVIENQRSLKSYVEKSKKNWLRFLTLQHYIICINQNTSDSVFLI